MRRIWTHLLARVVTIALCGDPTVALAATPAWVTERPTQPGFAVGIGSAEIDGDPITGVHNRALAAALADVAAQIDVDVESSLSLQTLENVEGITQHFESTATVTSSQTLQGVETMATWCGDSRCWVYARLDLVRREAVQREITAHRQQRLGELLRRLTDPRAVAATALAAGAEAVELSDGDAHIVALWRQRLDVITLNVVEQDEASAIEVVARDAGAPASGLPIRFDRHAEEGDIEPLGWTDTDGVASAAFDGLPGLTTATACIDYGTRREAGWVLPRRCVTIQVERVRRRTHLQVTVTPTASLGLRQAIAAQFAAHGLDVVTAADTAALSIDVDLRLSPAAETGSICFALVEVAVTVTEANERIHATTASRIRGAGLTREAAIRAALHKPGARLREATLHGRRMRVRVAHGGRPNLEGDPK
jgi:hypothetical protein